MDASVLIFLALVFMLSIPFWALGAIYQAQILPGLPFSALAAFAPSMAALILVYRNDHLTGALQLLQRSFDFRRINDKNWYFAILLINPVIAVLAYGYMHAIGRDLPLPLPLTLAIVPLCVMFFVGALGEEIGWTGYATESLQCNWGVIATGLFLGTVWAAWHFIPLLQAHRSFEWIAWWSLATISLRVIMVWIYTYSEKSLFAVAVFHAMINLSWQLFPINGSYYDPRVFGPLSFGIAILLLFMR